MSKKYVVLDLFVIHAITSDNLDLYFNTGRILQLIRHKCHKIVLTPLLKKEYRNRLKKLEKGVFTNDRLFKYLKSILVDSKKVDEEQEPSYVLKINVPQDDLPIIKAALSKGSSIIIVTTNRKHLVENEELKKFLKDKNIKIVLPEEAILELNRD